MKPSCCEIILEKTAITLYGSPSEAAGAALRGVLILDLKKETKVRSIQLRLEGRVQVIREVQSIDETIIDDVLTVVEPNSMYTLSAGKNAFEFEFRFPGHLPETVLTHFGQVSYRIKAIIGRPHIYRDIRIQKPVVVKRLPYPMLVDDAMSITQIYKDAANVRIQMPKRNYILGETVSLHIKIRPLKQGVAVNRVAFRLVQNLTLGVSDTSLSKTHQQWREISNNEVNCCEFLFNVRLPKNDIFQPGCFTEYIKTNHEAIVIVSFNIDGKIECGYITFNISITHKRQEDESLPAYTPIEENISPKLPSYKEIAAPAYQTCLIR